MEPPSKKMRKLLDDDSSDSGDDAGGVSLGKSPEAGFKVNAEYAKRFEYNKKREEVAKRKVTNGL
jgi:protein KRI1